MANFLRSQDIYIQVRRDGEPFARMSCNSGSFNPGIAVETFKVAGRSAPEVDGINGEAVLSLDINPRSPDYLRLLEIQRAKNAGDPEYRGMTIDAEFRADFGPDGRSRVLLPDCVVSEGTLSWQGGSDRVTTSVALTASTWRMLS